VLIVDDNATNRRLLRLQTRKWGMFSRETDSPAEALAWVRRGDPYDVALLDYQMPGMDGVALARELRKLPAGRRVALILLSSVSRPPGADRPDAEFTAVLTKPIKLAHLRERLRDALGESRIAAGGDERSAEPTPAATVPLRILLAEDHLLNQRVALRMLERLGYRADVVANGREVLERLAEAPYDVVLMDVQMPEMNGLDASRAICARWPVSQRPRIIAMTAEAVEGDRQTCLAAGMDDYVVKPVSLAQLQRALAQCGPRTAGPAGVANRDSEVADRTSDKPQRRDDVVDRGALRQLAEELGGAEALHEVIQTFLRGAPELLATLRDAAGQGDTIAIGRAAHTLKSSSAMVGAFALSNRCAELERLSRTEPIQAVRSRVGDITALYEAVEGALAEVS
jgi:CheY-like chemotaxis protein/HPt (histidine-containing phosphotransfer) domain-containing protein